VVNGRIGLPQKQISRRSERKGEQIEDSFLYFRLNVNQ
jgi:hypothetical protein